MRRRLWPSPLDQPLHPPPYLEVPREPAPDYGSHPLPMRRVQSSAAIVRTSADLPRTPLQRLASVGLDCVDDGGDRRERARRYGLDYLTPRQRFVVRRCRELAVVPAVFGLVSALVRAYRGSGATAEWSASDVLTLLSRSEHLLTAMWCTVAGYLAYCIMDGLMVRWLVMYRVLAAIVRMLTFAMLIVVTEQLVIAGLTPTRDGYGVGYLLHIWIVISCALTMVYTGQNFVTSNLWEEGQKRYFDMYNITVFAVVPVGVASFVTLVLLLRTLVILRLDIERVVG